MVFRFPKLSLALALFFITACSTKAPTSLTLPPVIAKDQVAVSDHYLLQNQTPFHVKGVVYVPAYPGDLPWELITQRISSDLKNRINLDIQDIAAMGANTIRLWDAPNYTYQAIEKQSQLWILQTIWFDVRQQDFQDKDFKAQSKATIARTLDRIYRNSEHPPRILAFLVGNELSRASVTRTDNLHPDITQYTGTYIQTGPNATATECFLAEMADYLKTYEQKRYGRQSLVSYANEIRTDDILDTPFLDFRSYNGYSYAVNDYQPEDAQGNVLDFGGWISWLKTKHPNIPLLVTETGLSISPNAHHKGAPHYGYGGNTEAEQAEGLSARWQDIQSASVPIAGLIIHEYLDAWWKFSKEDSLTQDPEDVEEWFGLVAFEKNGSEYTTQPRQSYKQLKQLWGKVPPNLQATDPLSQQE